MTSARVAAQIGIVPQLAVTQAPIQLDPVTAHPDFATSYKVPAFLSQQIVQKFAPTSALVTLVKIGSLTLVGVPGEPTSRVGQLIESAIQRKGQTVLVLSHVNGWIGYILDPEDYRRGGYEATLAFHGPETSTRVVEAVKRAFAQSEQPAPREKDEPKHRGLGF